MKKRFIITFVLTVLMSMIGTKSYAYDIEVENADGVTIYYNYINDGKELEVTYLYQNGGTYRGNVVIPDEVNFMNRTRKVTRISDVAFAYCSSLTSVTIPNSVKFIDRGAFGGCSGLTSITIPNSVTTIGSYAFYECSGLTSITIPNSVTSIGEYVFANCSGLTSITIGNGVKIIGLYAFEDCSSLTSVNISDVASWLNTNFHSNPLIYAHHLYLNGEEIKDLIIPNSVTSIGDGAFYGCSGLVSVTIPNSVTSIGAGAFCECSGLTSITIGNSVTNISNDAFSGCSGLVSVTIPNSVTCIGKWAFYACSGLTSVTIGSGVTSIGASAFSGSNITTIFSSIANPFPIFSFNRNTYLNATLYVPAGTIDKYKSTEGWKDFVFIEEWTGGNNEEPSETPDNPDDASTISGSCGETVSYSYDKATQTLTISGKGAVYDYDNESNKAPWSSYAGEIQKVEIESGITSIGYFAFYKCSGITSLSIPATVGYIGSSAFEDCTSLTSLSLSEGLLYFGGSAFEGCSGLQTLSIPSTVNTISINAFKNCKGITDVYCYAENVPDTHFDAFDATPTEKSILHVPANSVDAYRNSWPWSDFREVVAIDADGIMGVKLSDDRNGEYYDLTGRRILHPQKGLYIRNGKKVVVK